MLSIFNLSSKKQKRLQRCFSLLSIFSILLQTVSGIFLYQPVFSQELTPEPITTSEPTVSVAPVELIPQPTVTLTATDLITPTPEVIVPVPTEEITPTVTPEVTQTPTENPTDNQSNAPPQVAGDSTTPTPTVVTESSETSHLEAVILKETSAASIDSLDLEIQEQGSATLKTDKLDYAPTDTALITGAGFLAGKTYTIYITSETGPSSFSDNVTADSEGNLFYSYQLDGTYRPNYKVEVKDLERVVATTTFTDSPTATTVDVYNLQPDWISIGGGGVFAAYIGPPAYGYVSPGITTLYNGREAGIIKAGLNIDTDGHYKDEGLLAFQVPSLNISSFASQTLTYDVENETGSNPVWVRIRLVGGTQYQFVPVPYSTGWHTVDAAAGQWQLMDSNGNGIGSMMTLAEVATANSGATVDRVYLTLGMGDSYNVSSGVGTVAWVDKVTIGSVIYDFVVASAPVLNPTTNAATDIVSTDATLNGTNGENAATGHSFWVSLNTFSTASPTIPSGVYSSPDLGSIAANTDFSVSLASITTTGVPTNLPTITSGTTYYFAAWSLVGGTWYPGAVLNFTTAAPVPGTMIDSFAVLGGSTVTNTGNSVINGDLGVWPGLAITGFGPGIVNGTIHAGDGPASEAQADLTNVYNAKAGLACDTVLTGEDLGGKTLTPGVYCFDSSAQLTGSLVLNGLGDPNAVFVFKIGSTLTTASNSNVTLRNGAQACNVFWQVGSSATLGTGTHFEGNILALASITLNTGATLNGRALARNAAVTLDSNTVTKAVCSTGSFAYCGDSSVNQQFEQCDDGNKNDADYCTNNCQFNRVCLPDVNMVVNGGFETPVVSASQGWDILPFGTLGLGWLVQWYGGSTTYDGATRPAIANLELHHGVNGWSPQEGSQYAELDTDWNDHSGNLNGEPASVKISQTLPTIPDYRYEIKYAFSPRPNESASDNKLQSWWGGVGLGNHQLAGGSNTSWASYTFEQVATTNTTTLEFADQGTPNSLGTFIDNVSVKCLGPVTGNLQVGKAIDKDGNGTYEDLTNSVGFKWGYDAENPIRDMATVASNVPYGIHTVTESTNSDYYFTGWYSKKNQNTYSCEKPEGTTYPVSVTVSADADASAIILCNAKNPTCGDGIKNGQEQCDGTDGVTAGQNFCTNTCKLIPIYSGNNVCSNGKTPVQIQGPISVLGTNGTPVTVTLPSVGEYLIEATGDYGYGGDFPNNTINRADAGYATGDAWATRRDNLLGIPATAQYRGITSLLSDMGTGNMGIVNWGAFSPTHNYKFNYTPLSISDTNLKFVISDWYDTWYAGDPASDTNKNQAGMWDNAGGLNINVYECQALGSITITKDVVPNDASEWDFTIGGPGTTTQGYMNLKDGESHTFTDLVPGSYNVVETTDPAYSTTVTCDGIGPLSQNGFLLSLQPGQNSNCTFTNTRNPYCGDGIVNDREQCDGTTGVTAGQNFCSTSCNLIPIYDGGHVCPAGTVKSQNAVLSKTISATDADGESFTLTSGGKYLFEATGIFVPTSAAGYLSDAGYTLFNSVLSTQYGIHGTGNDYAAHALLANLGGGVGVVDWGDYNPDHIYAKYYEPTSSNVQFVIGDRYGDWFDTTYQNQTGMSDNSGSLTLNVYECQQPPVKIKAYKVVCNSEADLPNQTQGAIDQNTASNWVNSHSGCRLENQWAFQYGLAGAGSFGAFQTDTSVLPSPWNTFEVANDAVINDLSNYGGRIEVREVFPDNNYLPFSNAGNVSAEFYCTRDAANYDNWEWINNPQYGQTYYCVAFNALSKGTIIIQKDVLDPDGGAVDDNTSAFLATVYEGINYTGEPIASGNIAEGTPASFELAAGTYTVVENAGQSYRFDSCTPDSDSDPSNGTQVAVTVGQTTTVTCTNKQNKGRIYVFKDVLAPDGSPIGDNHLFTARLESGATDQFSEGITEPNQAEFIVNPGMHTVTEDADPNYDFVSCTPDADPNIPGTQVLVVNNQAAGNITCVNKQKYGSITITKDSIPNDAQDFTFTRSFGDAFILDDDSNATRPNTMTFNNLVVGSYSVTEANNSNWQLTGINCTGGQTSQDGRTINITLGAGENITCTFTNTKNGSISGFKYNDRNGNNGWGGWLSLENRMNNWKIFIDDNNNQTFDLGERNDTTGGWLIVPLGLYTFNNLLPGTYQICEKTQAGWYSSLPGGVNCQSATVGVGENKTGVNFGNHEKITIKAYKVVCDRESDLPNWGNSGHVITSSTAQNYVNSHPTCRLESGWDFQYGLDGQVNKYGNGDQLGAAPSPWQTLGTTNGINPAEIQLIDLQSLGGIWVRENLKPDYLPYSYPPKGPTEDNVSAEIYCHTDVSHYDNYDQVNSPLYGGTYYCVAFNTLNYGKLNVHKFEDKNNNGSIDSNENGLEGWGMGVYNGQGCVGQVINNGSQNTNSDGNALFENILPGDYSVKETQAAGWSRTTPECQNVTVITGQIAAVNVGNVQLGNIHGYKWNDLNGNGLEDVQEPRLGGWRIFIDGNDNQTFDNGERNMFTDNGGELGWYWFEDLLPGTYDICEEPQSGWVQTFPNPACHSVTLPYSANLESLFVKNSIGEAPPYNFGNTTRNLIGITLAKTNDKPNASAGDTVAYTLTLTNGSVMGNNVTVVDVLPWGFSYIAGTGSVNGSLTNPTIIGNILRWNLVSIDPNQVITITYQAKISDNQPALTYYNIASCFGETRLNQLTHFEPLDLYQCNLVTSKVKIGRTFGISAAISGTTNQVLGASTGPTGEVLGAGTGSETGWLVLAMMMIFGGTVLIKSKRGVKNV